MNQRIRGRGMPVACGAVGEFDHTMVSRIATGFGGGLGEAYRDAQAMLLLDREPLAWAGRGERGLAWPERAPAPIRDARGWQEAAAGGACGLVVMADGRRGLHASGSGVAPLYWMRNGDATYFATAIDPLVTASPRPLSPDWRSWASILLLGFVPGNGTPFEGIERLPPLALVEDAPGRSSVTGRGGLAWLDAAPAEPASAAEQIVAAMRAEIAAIGADPKLVCPLSGGFDSRLLACLLAELRPPDLTAWTVNIDQGNEQEESFAAAVAAELGVPHEIVDEGRPEFHEELAAAARRVEYESLPHLEMTRLVGGLPRSGLVVDGLAGDVLIKGLFLDRPVVDAPDWRTAADRAFDRLVSARLGTALFEPGTWEGVRATVREAFVHEAERFAGHPSAASLTLYWTRTRRGVGTAPTRVFGENRAIAMPFLADDVARAALSAPLEAKLDGALYRRVLDLVNPRVAALPSTNDGLSPPRRTRRPVKRSREARRTYLALLERSPLRPWFGEQLEMAIARGELGGLVRSGWLLPRLHYLCALTLWSERYRERLADGRPDAPFPKRPKRR